MSSLPKELQRAEFLMRRLDNAIRVAKQFNAAKASIPVENAEELVELLADSLRTVRRMDGLREFDGTAEPIRNTVAGELTVI
jgi:thiamine biosynthesis lipoprotein ApbE